MTFGGKGFWSNVDATVPVEGQFCNASIPDLPITLPHPFLTMLGKVVVVCARVIGLLKWQCFTLDLALAGSLWAGPFTSNHDHPHAYLVEIPGPTGDRLVFCSYEQGSAPQESFDLSTSTWTVTPNVLPKSPFPTGGNPVCLMAGNYLYLIGGKTQDMVHSGAFYAQRLYLQPPPPSINKWELVDSRVPTNLMGDATTCAPNPTNKNQILCASLITGNSFYVLDIHTGLAKSISFKRPKKKSLGYIGEVCSDNRLYALGAGAHVLIPDNLSLPLLSGSGAFTPIVGVPKANRAGGTTISFPLEVLKTYNPNVGASCTGC